MRVIITVVYSQSCVYGCSEDRHMHENEINNYLAVIKVVGVGGGGTNAVCRQ